MEVNKTSINFGDCAVCAEEHNSRDQKYLDAVDRSGKKTYDIFRDRTHLNEVWRNPQYEGKGLSEIKEECRQRYVENFNQKPYEGIRELSRINKKTGKPIKYNKRGWSPLREGVCVIKPTTKLEDFRKVDEWMKDKGITIIRIDIHRDEGHIDPKTGERVYNYHAHLICDWTDHATGKTIKLTKDDMSELNRVILPDALGMQPGEPKSLTGRDHLTPAQYREKAAGKRAVELEEQNRILEEHIEQSRQREMEQLEREKEATTRAERAGKRASRAELKQRVKEIGGSFLDLTARILRVFGHGAIARAQEEAYEAIHQSEEEKTARILAEVELEKALENSRKASIEMDKYAKQKYEEGYQEGVNTSKVRIDKANERAVNAENELAVIKKLYPVTRNLKENIFEMQSAGIEAGDIRTILRNGIKENVRITFEDAGVNYSSHATVELIEDEEGLMQVRCNKKSLEVFMEEVIHLEEKHRGVHL